MKHFRFYNKQDILSLTKLRRYETKLGERLQCVNDPLQFESFLQSTKAIYFLIGIPEDIGVRANYGMGGASTTWIPFLQSLRNIEGIDFPRCHEMVLVGYFDFLIIK